MREGWHIKKLSEVASVATGNSAPQNRELFKNGIFPFIRTSDVGKIRKGKIGDSFDKLNEQGIKGLKKHVKGTILFPKSGASTFLNHRVLMDFDGYVSSHLATIKASPEKINDFFLLYFLMTIDARHLMQDNAYPSLKASDISSIKVPIPPLVQQQRIVSILDEAFAAIDKAKANYEQNLKNAKELFESYLEEVFQIITNDCKTRSLADVCVITSKLIDPKEDKYQNLIHIGAGNIESKTGRLVDLKTAKEEGLVSNKFLFSDEMVLYSKIRPYLDKVVSCKFDGLCSADIYPLFPIKKLITKDYLYYLLRTQKFIDYAVLGSQRAGMPKVNREHLFAYEFLIPSIGDQQSRTQKFDIVWAETKKLEAIYTKKIKDLDELKKSLLQKAFSGELTANQLVEANV